MNACPDPLKGRRHSLLGIKIDAVTGKELIETVTASIEAGCSQAVFGNHNLHSLHLFHKLPELRRFYDHCSLTHVDGMSLVLLARAMGLPLTRSHRTSYLDWIEEFLEVAAQKEWRLYVLGGPSDVAEALPKVLLEKYPRLQVRTHKGFFRIEEDRQVVESIAQFEPHVLMVGMGMPQQEAWILRNLSGLKAQTIFNCGAAFEYLAGAKHRPPRWAGQLGVEWLFRMASEPRRLAHRYLIEPLYLLPLLLQAASRRLKLMSDALGNRSAS
jgi:N-acetylglucosaminyldiphosphoundecaprenol N-acetyl-beta-D-mannosaminyltransferase